MNAPQLIPIPVDDPLPMAWLDMNDLGNAHRLVRLARGLLRLFATMPKERPWGFLVDGRMMPWREHKAMREGLMAANRERAHG